MKKSIISIVALIFCHGINSQVNGSLINSFFISDSVRVTIDRPVRIRKAKETIICFYALPNGNTTEQTMGKKLKEGDDWHFDIQHIRAQTAFIRKEMKRKNFIVIYLENNYKSWPLWKQKHPDFTTSIPNVIDTVKSIFDVKHQSVYLNGHSGGGSFIFGYLASVNQIPAYIKRISFLDSDYGYDSTYYLKFRDWLLRNKNANLNVFAYNDSVALYNGKSIVSAKGGTWYKSHLVLRHLQNDFLFDLIRNDSIINYSGCNSRVQFFFKTNPERKIFHTQQVELNGFIHSILVGTPSDSRGYSYYSKRAYEEFIKE